MRNKFKKLTHAFSMIELVFVIVILGIVSSIGSSLIVKTYESYILQKAIHKVSLSTELAAVQLVNRLTYRINNTTVAKRPTAPYDYVTVSSVSSIGDSIHTALEWIGYDNDSFDANYTAPGWSGYADPRDANVSRFATPGSDISIADTIIKNLSNNAVSLLGVGQRPAIFFHNKLYNNNDSTSDYSPACMGLDYATNNTSCVLAVSGTHNALAHDVFTFSSAAHSAKAKTIMDQYKLAWSAYTVAPIQITGQELTDRGFQAADTIYDLTLYYNYQPWLGEEYHNAASSAILLKNVSVFKFSESGGTIRFKLCAQQITAGTDRATVCKEKAIIR
jgi:prepilin-type N-terminal cleavage/methylation domain-containing protein